MYQKGFSSVLLLLGSIAIITFITLIYFTPLKNSSLRSIYPIGQSFAQTNSSPWESERVLFNSSGSAFVATSGNTINFATSGINYRKSTDQGITLGPISNPGSGSLYLDDALASEGPNIYMVSVADIRTVTDFIGPRPVGNIYFRRSTNDGQSWSTPIKLTSNQGALRIGIAASGPNIHVIWMDYRSLNVWDLYYVRSIDGGMTWLPEIKLVSGTNAVGAERPVIATSGTSVHIAWMDGRNNNPSCTIETGFLLQICTEVYYKRSLNNGTTWDADTRLTNDSTKYSGRPDIAAFNNTILILFDHTYDTSGNEQSLLRSADNGTSWGSLQRISNNPGDSTHGSVVLDGNGAHTAWFDYRNSGNTEIYYRMSKDAGINWEPEERVTNASGDSSTPLLALTPNYLHLTFLDKRTGTFQSYYNRRNLTNTQFPSPTPMLPSQSPFKVGDIVVNQKIDIFDYNALLTDFGKKNDPLTPADLDDDNDVDIFDYNLLLTNFGQ